MLKQRNMIVFEKYMAHSEIDACNTFKKKKCNRGMLTTVLHHFFKKKTTL